MDAPHGAAEQGLYPDIGSWLALDRTEYERRYPHMPERLVDNLVAPEAKVSVVPWRRIDEGTLKSLVNLAFEERATCQYDLGRRMRRINS